MCCVDEEGGLRVGSAAEQTLTEIWHGPQAQYIRNKHIQADMSGLDPCSKCVGWHPLSYSTRPPEGDVVGTLLERIPIELE
jgi:hypothetical protein